MIQTGRSYYKVKTIKDKTSSEDQARFFCELIVIFVVNSIVI